MPMKEDDLLRFVWIADPQISPDGSRIAFTRVEVDREADEYRTRVWLAETREGAPLNEREAERYCRAR